MAKRKDVSEIDSVHESVTVHGMVSYLSPVKQSRRNTKNFDGKFSDWKKTMRMVAFDPHLRVEMKKYSDENTAVAVVNCQIKETPGQYQSGGIRKFIRNVAFQPIANHQIITEKV
jgi:hypothetical protein